MAPITVTAHAEEGADPLALVDGLVKDKLRADLASGEAVKDDTDADKPKDDESEDATTVDLEESSEDEAPEADEVEADEEEAAEADRDSLGLGRRESKLFAEESRAHESPSSSPRALSLDSLHEGGGALVPPPESAFTPGLSLMASSSPASSYSSPGSGFGLGDPLGVPPLFDETKWIQSQIDADEVLARQLQEEEEERKKKFKPRASRAKPNVVPSRWDAWLGEPMRHEVRHNYSRVPKAAPADADSPNSPPRPRSCAESAGDLGLSALTGAFRSWGSSVTAAATDFFGEDIKMQVKGPRGASSPSGRFRNEV